MSKTKLRKNDHSHHSTSSSSSKNRDGPNKKGKKWKEAKTAVLPVDPEQNQQRYAVVKIKKKKFFPGYGECYWVKWAGYESDENTWEPASSLASCPRLLKEFETKWAEKKIKEKRKRTALKSNSELCSTKHKHPSINDYSKKMSPNNPNPTNDDKQTANGKASITIPSKKTHKLHVKDDKSTSKQNKSSKKYRTDSSESPNMSLLRLKIIKKKGDRDIFEAVPVPVIVDPSLRYEQEKKPAIKLQDVKTGATKLKLKDI